MFFAVLPRSQSDEMTVSLFEWFFMPVVRKLFPRRKLLRVHYNFDYASFLVDTRTLVIWNLIIVLCFFGISIFFDIFRLIG